ncbi:hypothetical protein KIPB_008780, partial [Kipferlia bialata]
DTFVSLPCGHTFHNPCILQSLEYKRTCPSCRVTVPKGKGTIRPVYASLSKRVHRMLAEEEEEDKSDTVDVDQPPLPGGMAPISTLAAEVQPRTSETVDFTGSARTLGDAPAPSVIAPPPTADTATSTGGSTVPSRAPTPRIEAMDANGMARLVREKKKADRLTVMYEDISQKYGTVKAELESLTSRHQEAKLQQCRAITRLEGVRDKAKEQSARLAEKNRDLQARLRKQQAAAKVYKATSSLTEQHRGGVEYESIRDDIDISGLFPSGEGRDAMELFAVRVGAIIDDCQTDRKEAERGRKQAELHSKNLYAKLKKQKEELARLKDLAANNPLAMGDPSSAQRERERTVSPVTEIHSPPGSGMRQRDTVENTYKPRRRRLVQKKTGRVLRRSPSPVLERERDTASATESTVRSSKVLKRNGVGVKRVRLSKLLKGSKGSDGEGDAGDDAAEVPMSSVPRGVRSSGRKAFAVSDDEDSLLQSGGDTASEADESGGDTTIVWPDSSGNNQSGEFPGRKTVEEEPSGEDVDVPTSAGDEVDVPSSAGEYTPSTEARTPSSSSEGGYDQTTLEISPYVGYKGKNYDDGKEWVPNGNDSYLADLEVASDGEEEDWEGMDAEDAAVPRDPYSSGGEEEEEEKEAGIDEKESSDSLESLVTQEALQRYTETHRDRKKSRRGDAAMSTSVSPFDGKGGRSRQTTPHESEAGRQRGRLTDTIDIMDSVRSRRPKPAGRKGRERERREDESSEDSIFELSRDSPTLAPKREREAPRQASRKRVGEGPRVRRQKREREREDPWVRKPSRERERERGREDRRQNMADASPEILAPNGFEEIMPQPKRKARSTRPVPSFSTRSQVNQRRKKKNRRL